ncbi:MAG: 3-dehydroquinate synthase [Verrucomicrobiota bacterium]
MFGLGKKPQDDDAPAPPQVVTVSAGGGSYEVRIGEGVLGGLGPALKAMGLTPRAAVIADEAIAKVYGPHVTQSLQEAGFHGGVAAMPSGEASKDLGQVGALLSFCAQQGLDRRSPVIALGGGVVGDLTGYVAASYMRGVPLVQIPTTLLAMVDSSVGGKTGVNLPEGKNLAGAFHQPVLVLADLDTLLTLPVRERAAGIAEIIKAGIIADEKLFATVENGCPADIAPIIRRSVEIKAEVVAADEKETSGRRALLNFGHTLGHAIENAAGYGQLLHGEAISIGMRAAAHLSAKRAGLDAAAVRRIEAALAANQLPLALPEPDAISNEDLWEALRRDKKHSSGRMKWVLCPRIGEAHVSADVTEHDVNELMELVRSEPG